MAQFRLRYAKLAVLTFIVINDPSVIHQLYTGQGQDVARDLGQAEVKERLDSAVAKTRSLSTGDAGPARSSFFPGGRSPSARDAAGKLAQRAAAPSPSAGRPPSTAPASSPVLVTPRGQPRRRADMRPLPSDPPPSTAYPSNANLPSNAYQAAPTPVQLPSQAAAAGHANRPWPTAPSQTSSPAVFGNRTSAGKWCVMGDRCHSFTRKL